LILLALGWWLIPFLYGEEFAPATSAALILVVGFGLANTLYWNRPLLLALEKPVYPLAVSAVAMVFKVGLAIWLVPQFGYLMQAVLLSAYLTITVGLNAWQGVRTVRQRSSVEAAAA
jgi:O-antigen/teichoic acid export membrane protein